MKLALQLLALSGAALLSGCCSQCAFWDAVQKGYYINPEREEKLQGILDQSMPMQVKTLARIIVRRGNRERVFSMLAKADRKKRELLVAGITDLGNVLFRAQWAENKGTRILANRSGWDDLMIRNVIVRDLLAVLLPDVNPMNIIEDHDDKTVTLRSMDENGSIDQFVFDQSGKRWQSYERTTHMLMGEVTYVYRLTLHDWQTIPGHPSPVPHTLQIADEAHGYTAQVEFRKISVVNQ